MKRQRGRNRNNNNKNRNNNHNNHNRSMDSQGPDVKVRGTASTIYEKYTTLARDAKMSGHRVKAENLLQHAEHYLRVMNVQEAAKREAQEAREKAEAERAAKRAENGEDDNDNSRDNNRQNRNNRNNRRSRENAVASEETTNTPTELDVVTPEVEAPKAKAKPKKAKPVSEDADAPETTNLDAVAAPKRRRKAPARKSEETDETIEAAE